MTAKYIYILIFVFFLLNTVKSQSTLNPIAKFSFNNASDADEIGKARPKLVGVKYTNDRFGNEKNAVYLFGNEASYINLGNYSAIKPKVGSISLWVKVENPIHSGKGHVMNPIIITKRSNDEDFYEAYVMCYYPHTEKVCSWFSKDSLKQINITSVNKFEMFKWHHLVLTYDYSYCSLYIDGKLEEKLQKNFETQFLKSDSVMIGVTANKKNKRFLNASIDDIEFYDRVLMDNEIEELYHAPNPNRLRNIINQILVSMIIFAVLILFYFIIKFQLSLRHKKEKQRLELANKLLETELIVNKTLMNPHFVFNSLNSIQNFILNHENEQANNYLVKFSKLIRKTLESNMADSITLEAEIELLKRYLELEELRFEDNITHIFDSENILSPSTIHMPIMMIQPFVENAIWHGLKNKIGNKTIKLTFSIEENKYLTCVVEDNGIGRKKEEPVQNEKKSLATVFIKQRLDLLNKIHNLNCDLKIIDRPNNNGTLVVIILPILNTKTT